MKIIEDAKEMQQASLRLRGEGKRIGFVPTMGYLHEGHLSLVKASKNECDITVVSIFVNPTQFAPEEDLEEYPRDLDRDKTLLEKENIDILFVPTTSEVYPYGYGTYVEVTGEVSSGLCASSRPGHFRGVTTVVAKLFNIVSPDEAYFGQKDYQQAAVIKKMVRDLNFSNGVRMMPIVREEDGLAMSSRNTYLSKDERVEALKLNKALQQAKKMITEGETEIKIIKDSMQSVLSGSLEIDYIEIVDPETLHSLNKIQDEVVVLVAAFAGKTRLIDNCSIRKGVKTK